MDPFLGEIMIFGHAATSTNSDSHERWITLESMSSPIYRSVPIG